MKEVKYNNRGYIVDTIYGKEIVRNCDSNVAKMKIYEWCYYKVFHWGYFSEGFGLIVEQGLEVLKNTFYFIVNLVSILLSPLVLVCMARIDIKRSQNSVKKFEKMFNAQLREIDQKEFNQLTKEYTGN